LIFENKFSIILNKMKIEYRIQETVAQAILPQGIPYGTYGKNRMEKRESGDPDVDNRTTGNQEYLN
jgi:hypothetical protein